MKNTFLVFAILLLIQMTRASQPCLPEGIIFTSQAQIDNFPTDYPNCSEIEGNVRIGGEFSDINNLSGLQGVASIGGYLNISSNPDLTSLIGLGNLTSIGSDLYVLYNTALTSLPGLEGLNSIGRDVWIGDNTALTSLAGIDNIDAGSIIDLYILYNNTLSTCEVQSVCDYLASPNGFYDILLNATGCSTAGEVVEACESILVEDLAPQNEFSVFPNPAFDYISINFTLENTAKVTIELTNSLGHVVATILDGQLSQGKHQIEWNAEDLPAGIYFYRISSISQRQASIGKIVVMK